MKKPFMKKLCNVIVGLFILSHVGLNATSLKTISYDFLSAGSSDPKVSQLIFRQVNPTTLEFHSLLIFPQSGTYYVKKTIDMTDIPSDDITTGWDTQLLPSKIRGSSNNKGLYNITLNKSTDSNWSNQPIICYEESSTGKISYAFRKSDGSWYGPVEMTAGGRRNNNGWGPGHRGWGPWNDDWDDDDRWDCGGNDWGHGRRGRGPHRGGHRWGDHGCPGDDDVGNHTPYYGIDSYSLNSRSYAVCSWVCTDSPYYQANIYQTTPAKNPPLFAISDQDINPTSSSCASDANNEAFFDTTNQDYLHFIFKKANSKQYYRIYSLSNGNWVGQESCTGYIGYSTVNYYFDKDGYPVFSSYYNTTDIPMAYRKNGTWTTASLPDSFAQIKAFIANAKSDYTSLAFSGYIANQLSHVWCMEKISFSGSGIRGWLNLVPNSTDESLYAYTINSLSSTSRGFRHYYDSGDDPY